LLRFAANEAEFPHHHFRLCGKLNRLFTASNMDLTYSSIMVLQARASVPFAYDPARDFADALGLTQKKSSTCTSLNGPETSVWADWRIFDSADWRNLDILPPSTRWI
jgi:hypothetical protein